MRVVEEPYLQKAVDFPKMAEKAKDAQSRINDTIPADCYRSLPRPVASISSASDAEIEAMAQRIAKK
jgi:hypothetical protein